MERKKPRQGRAVQTVDYIAEAVVQVLDHENPRRFTTNHIAEKAGVSIGTLYRYFPDKGALLRFVVRREMTKASDWVRAMIDASTARTPDAFLEDVVTESMSAFGARRRTEHHIRVLARNDDTLVSEMRALRLEVSRRITARLHELEPDRFRRLTDDRLLAAGEAFGHVIQTLGESALHPADEARLRADLIHGLVASFSRGGAPGASADGPAKAE